MNRRSFLKGAAATIAALAASNAAPPAAAAQTLSQWTPVEAMQWTVRIVRVPRFAPAFQINDLVQVKLLPNRRDRRTYKAQSLEPADGRVRLVVPAGAMPWRYVEASGIVSRSSIRRMKKAHGLNRRHPGRMYVVQLIEQKTLVLVSHWRARLLSGARFDIGEIHAALSRSQGRETDDAQR